MDLALNNLQRLICHKTKTTKPNQTNKNTKLVHMVETGHREKVEGLSLWNIINNG